MYVHICMVLVDLQIRSTVFDKCFATPHFPLPLSLCAAFHTAAGKFILWLLGCTIDLLCVSEMLLLWMPTTAENPSECRSRQVVVS